MSSYNAFTGKYPFLKDTFTVKSKKGYHVYLEYIPSLKSGSKVMTNFKDIDIINDKKLIFAPNTTYLDQDKQKVVYKFYNDLKIKRLNKEEIDLIRSEVKKKTDTVDTNSDFALNDLLNVDEIEKISDFVQT